MLAALCCAPVAAFAQSAPSGPVVDVVEVAGIIDSHIERYMIERLDASVKAKDALLVFQLDSFGGVKLARTDGILDHLRGASIPVAVFIGPRRAVASGVAIEMAGSASIAAIGPSARATQGGRSLGANEAVAAGVADLVAPSVAEMLRRLDGRTVGTAGGSVTLRLPSAEVVVRFFQPGPLRRLLHAFANPGLVYLCLLAGAMLMVFELFQPGFGVAGVSGVLLLTGAVYGLTVLPATWEGLAAVAISLGLLTFDVARDELLLPTVAGTAGLAFGSLKLFPSGAPAFRLSSWLIGFTVAGALIFFVPVMTMVRRARKPIGTGAGSRLIGQRGDVRSVLNPEGFVWVAGELWRARTDDGGKLRVGEPVEITGVDGAVVLVRGTGVQPEPNGAAALAPS